jgi:hypothetical protein
VEALFELEEYESSISNTLFGFRPEVGPGKQDIQADRENLKGNWRFDL